MATLSLRHINKLYGNRFKAIDDFNLKIEPGEFVVLVGPSGSGKSTILRMIAGLEEISVGELFIDDILSNEIPPKDRSIAMVFQNYALYPHLTVYENVAFGLKSAHLGRVEEKQRIESVARLLEIESLLGRKPGHLSGGQKQRVALARAIVRSPRIFLLDEPLSNLDALLRNQMRVNIARLHHELKTTFVYVTHDQLEALSLADKIVVLKDGHTMQVGTPKEIYETPANRFVATFLGNPPMNIIPSRLGAQGESFTVGDFKIELPASRKNEFYDQSYFGKQVDIGLRAHHFHVVDTQLIGQPNTIPGQVLSLETNGENSLLEVTVSGLEHPLAVSVKTDSSIKRAGKIALEIHPGKIHVFDQHDGRRLMGIPTMNYLKNLSLRQNNNGFRLSIGEQAILLDLGRRLLDLEAVHHPVDLSVKTDSISLTKTDGSIELHGVISHLIAYENRTGIFLTLAGISEKMAFLTDDRRDFKVGDTLEFFIDPSGVNLSDAASNRLIAKHPVSTNRIPSAYHKRIVMRKGLHEAGPNFFIKPAAIAITDKRYSRSGLVIPAEIYDVDFMGKTSVLYCRVPLSQDYFTVIVGRPFDMHLTPRIRLMLPYEAINQSDEAPLS